MDFSGKVAIVTGGASGMGRATVEGFRSAGGQVLIVDQNAQKAAEVADQTGAQTYLGDVAQAPFCDEAVNEALRLFGRLDILINAAGVIVRARGVDTTTAQWNHVMSINVGGTFFMSKAAIPAMIDGGGGSIVNFGSIWGDLGADGVLAYCASKGAVHNLTRAMALEHVLDQIRINAVCPGEVNTPMLQSERSEPVTKALLDRLAKTVPMQRLANPSEIADVVLFLASDRASYMTGSLIKVDAGYSAE